MGSTKEEVAYLGPPTSYTHQTALSIFSQENYVFTPQVTIKDVFSVVQNSHVSFGVIPFENSSNGSVIPTIDLLIDREKKFGDVLVCGEAYLPVRHCLLGYIDPVGEIQALQSTTYESGPRASRARPAADLRHITRILSHPQAFGQCETFLSTYLKGIELKEVSSTSKAARMVAEDPSKTTAAISSSLAADLLGLRYLARDIQDREDNTTRFFVLRKGPRPDSHMIFPMQPVKGLGSVQWKTMVSFDIDHRVSGALADALLVFKTLDLNLTSINSRPSRLLLWHYKFLVEFEGKVEADDEGPGTKALASLAKITSGSRWVGSWVDRMNRIGA